MIWVEKVKEFADGITEFEGVLNEYNSEEILEKKRYASV